MGVYVVIITSLSHQWVIVKQINSFSKEDRFPSVSKKSTNAMCYNLPDTLKKRGAGFGIGQRFKTPLEQRKCKS